MPAYQAYATADLGVIAFETEARQGLVLDEGVLARDRPSRHRRPGG
jgi:phenylacetate-CoA ligase